MKNNFFNIFNDNPTDNRIYTKIKYLFLSLILIYTGILASFIIMYGLNYFIVHVLQYESILEMFSKSNNIVSKRNMFFVALVGPLIEESIFRLPLRINKLYIAISIVFLSYFLIHGKIETFDFTNSISYAKVIGVVVIGSLTYFLLSPSSIDKLNKYRKYIIWCSIIAFGLIHLSNIYKVGQMYWQLSLFYPFFVLPYMIMGYFMTNLRLKYGFLWGFLLHAIINSIGTFSHHI
jgi:Type II CAAX prenyl endopeptidase Rce1-like